MTKNLKSQIKKYIDTLPISEAQRNELINYYEKVWLLVDSGEISLELDFHAKFFHHSSIIISGFSPLYKGYLAILNVLIAFLSVLEIDGFWLV